MTDSESKLVSGDYGEAGFRQFEAAFFRAADAAGGVYHTRIRLAGIPVRFEFAGPALHERISAPFRHLESPDGEDGITVRIWDTESTGIDLPGDVPRPVSVYAQSLPSGTSRGDLRWSYLRPDPGLTCFSESRQSGVYWIPAASCLSYGDLVGGFRSIFTWAMAARGLTFLHSGAIGVAGRAALIVGPSGSGKSSTALAGLFHGMDYLGDDHCLLEARETVRVHSVYAVAKLVPDQLVRYPALKEYLLELGPEAGKLVALLHPGFASQLPATREVAAVFVPCITNGTSTEIRPLSRPAALAALAPSTLLQMADADRSALSVMAALVRKVPCFRLALGEDRSEVASAIASFLDSLPEGERGG